MFWTDKLTFFQGIIELVRFIISQENVRGSYGLKYDRLIQSSGNIIYFGHVRFSAFLGKLSKLQQ